MTLQLRHKGRDGISNNQPHDCLLNRLFRHRSKKTSKLRVTGLCLGNSSVTGEFPAQMASNTENVSIWWCLHEICQCVGIWLTVNWHYICRYVREVSLLGLHSLNEKKCASRVSHEFEVISLDGMFFRLLWKLTGGLAALLLNHQSNFKANGKF